MSGYRSAAHHYLAGHHKQMHKMSEQQSVGTGTEELAVFIIRNDFRKFRVSDAQKSDLIFEVNASVLFIKCHGL
jgi:hypothetical protein